MRRQLSAIIEETFREALARKTLIGFAIFSTVLILVALIVLQMDFVQENLLKPMGMNPEMQRNNPKLASMIGATVLDYLWTVVSGILFFITIAIGVFATASFMTSMMEKGSIDLLLSKPVPRWLYIVGRYMGAVLIMLLEVAYFVFGLWIVVGLSTGQWNEGFLSAAIFILLGFAGIYAIVTLVSVFSRSSWLAIIIGITLYFVAGIVAAARFFQDLEHGEGSTGWASRVATVLHYILPQTGELAQNITNAIVGNPLTWTPVLLTLGITAAYLGISVLAFQRKEF